MTWSSNLVLIFDPYLSLNPIPITFLSSFPGPGLRLSLSLSPLAPLYRPALISDSSHFLSVVLKHTLTFQRTLMASHFRPKEVQTPQSALASPSLSRSNLSSRLTSCMTLYAPSGYLESDFILFLPMYLLLSSLPTPFSSVLTYFIKIHHHIPFFHRDLNSL